MKKKADETTVRMADVESDKASALNALKSKEHRFMPKQTGLLVAAVLLFIISFGFGRYPISPGNLLMILASRFFPVTHTWPANLDIVVWNVRLPRIFAAMLVGAALSTSGAAFQGMFKNPLVSPDILGASMGAGFGAALGLYFSLDPLGIELLAFFFGLFAVLLAYYISSRIRFDPMLVLVLCGVLVGTIFSALTSLIKLVADPMSKLPAITFFLMGSLATVTPRDVFVVIIPMLLGGIPLFILRWRLNVLSLGDEEAMALGLDTRKMRFIVIICSTLMTSAAVSISGLIGWVGLIVPHLARMIVGPNFKMLLPTAIILGSAYLLLVDDIARCLFSTEVPLGILTALIGAPFFLCLLLKGQRGWK